MFYMFNLNNEKRPFGFGKKDQTNLQLSRARGCFTKTSANHRSKTLFILFISTCHFVSKAQNELSRLSKLFASASIAYYGHFKCKVMHKILFLRDIINSSIKYSIQYTIISQRVSVMSMTYLFCYKMVRMTYNRFLKMF